MPVAFGHIRASEALNLELVSGRYRDKPLYLSLDDTARLRVAERLSSSPEAVEAEIVQAVGKGLCTTGDPFAFFNEIASSWRDKNRSDVPPFTALLFAQSYAAALMADDGDYGSANYYDRLAEALEFPADKLRTYGKSMVVAWRMFNAWLVENDYDFGRPTARPFNANKYINYGQTQAIIRAGDRPLFHDLFERFGFSSADELEPDELRQYVAQWFRSNVANDRLRKAWAEPDLRDRFCEIVRAELGEWARARPAAAMSSGSGSHTRLHLVAQIVRQFPKPSFVMRVGRSAETSPDAAVLSEEASGYQGILANEAYGAFATLSPNPINAVPGMLEAGLELRGGDESVRGAFWRPRLIVPFSKSHDGPYWIEVARIGLATPHMVLVKNTPALRQKVEAYFSVASTGVAKVADYASLPGVPSGWMLYDDVVIIRPDEGEEHADLAPLMPLREEAGIVAAGGMRLARDIWHARAPPDFAYLSSDQPTTIQVTRMDHVGGEGEVLASSAGESLAAIFPAAAMRELGDGEYTVGLLPKRKRVSDVGIILRSAMRPRPLDRQGAERLIYLNVGSAEPVEENGDNQGVEGLLCRLNADVSLPVLLANAFASIPAGNLAESGLANPPLGFSAAVERQTCVSRGYHIWQCETLKPDLPRSTPLQMKCRGCSVEVLARNRGRKGGAIRKPASPAKPWKATEAAAAPMVDHDLLFDALCFLGAGNTTRIEALLADSIDEPWRVESIVTDYSALGLLDVQLDGRSGKSTRWCVPSPALCMTSQRSAFLAGFRSTTLLESIRAQVEILGGKYSETPRPNGPSLVEISDLDGEGLRLAMSDILDPFGRSISVVTDGAQSLAAGCLQLDGLLDCLSEGSLPSTGAYETFDSRGGRWVECQNSHQVGAYRSTAWGTRYFFRTHDQRAFLGPNQVVKLLAARAHGVRLHTYDAKTREFISTLGAEPVGLLRRMLVCASGQLPEVRNGIVVYAAVPATVANVILHIMYED